MLVPSFLTSLKFASDFGLSSQSINCLQQTVNAGSRVELKAVLFMVRGCARECVLYLKRGEVLHFV